jgi:7-cyano-7-deazaguanine synthase
MCGIGCYWARESILSREEYDKMLEGASKRGQDGIGVAIINPDGTTWFKRVVGNYKDHRDDVLSYIISNLELGGVLLFSSRATPETEKQTTDTSMIQPVVYHELFLVHNGGITDSIVKELKKNRQFYTQIDSESIIHAYLKYGKNLKEAVEYLVGSWAFIMLDMRKKKLYSCTSFNPLAHMYIKGYGNFLHSDLDTLTEILHNLTGQTKDGVNVWENWYHHYIDGYTIVETDLDSGFQHHIKYTPRFLHPVWDSRKTNGKTKVLVSCSGGIDSGLTAYLFHILGYETEIIHFTYPRKSERAEYWAVSQLTKRLQHSQIIDLGHVFVHFDDCSMLTDHRIEVTSGGDNLKSTIAWESGRNTIFASILMGFAESEILRENYEKILISAGWAQLSEETGGYPDNSFKFAQSINELKNYGYITGSRIEFVPVLAGLTKTEVWKLGQALGFPFEITCSCDNPLIGMGGIPYLCTNCGSTKLSILASDRAGVEDKRKFFNKRPKLSEPMQLPSIENIIDRLILPKEDKEKLNALTIQRGS